LRLSTPGNPHLTYCTNIHAGETWAEVRGNLERYVTAVKRQVAPDQPFGVGLRLSGIAAQTMSEPGEVEAFRDFLARNGMYVFTINGFPFGPFHGTRVKEEVYLPSWLDESRLTYTDRLARLLAAVLPDEPGLEGTVSTLPGAFKPLITTPEDVARMAQHLLRHAAMLHRLHQETGKVISLAIEPEPWCFVETVAEAVAFFQDHLFSKAAAGAYGLSEEVVRRHLGLCFDACHMAVGFEEPLAAIGRLTAAGIRIGKIQVSAGLKVIFDGQDAPLLAALRPFAEGVYLHQTVERTGGRLSRYLDLPEALATAETGPSEPREWRIHFHVPLFRERLGLFSNTQDYLRELLALVKKTAVSPHLEVETYTWDVLPEQYRREGVVAAVARELQWVMQQL
jgi:sugar phosphate isomerase/epimerase